MVLYELHTQCPQGGESTLQEMCMSVALYYPKISLENSIDLCMSAPTRDSFGEFHTTLQGLVV